MSKNEINQLAKNQLMQLESIFVTLKPIIEEKFAVCNLVKSNYDLDRLQKLEIQLQEEKQKVDSIKTEFVQNIQHSIRTPFNGV